MFQRNIWWVALIKYGIRALQECLVPKRGTGNARPMQMKFASRQYPQTKDQKRFAVQVSDTRMLNRIIAAGFKKYLQ